MIPINKLRSFSEAGQEVLTFLSKYFACHSWMLARVSGNELIVLQIEDNHYQIRQGDVLNQQDAFYFQINHAPAQKTAVSSLYTPLYKHASINSFINIKSYPCQPILQENRALFGTLCSISHPYQQSKNTFEETCLIQLLANLLSNILQLELRKQEEIRKAEHFMTEALTDPLTHTFNRRAWDQFILSEEIRCKKYASPASVLIIDINYLKQVNDQLGHPYGDNLLKKMASILKACVRPNDIVARLGGDEFGILLIETNEDDSIAVLNRINYTLEQNKIDAAIGLAIRHPLEGLFSSIKAADLQMYLNKKAKKASVTSSFIAQI